MEKNDWLTVISVFFGPGWPAPALVVIKITPFRPNVPYNVVAARPFNTSTLAMLLGSRSKKREGAGLPSKKFPGELVSLLKGTPSTMKSAWLLPLKELKPLMVTLVPEPDVPPPEVICTPAALPLRTLATSPSERFSIWSAPTEVTE